MNARCSRRGFLVGAGTAVVAGCTSPIAESGPDTPESLGSDWPLPGYDSRIRNYTPAATGPEDEIAELWAVDGDSDCTPPVVADERVFVGSEKGAVRALDAQDGEELWEVTVGTSVSQPQVGSEFVYVATDEATVALSPDTGDEEWRIETAPNVSHSSDGREEVPTPAGILSTPHGLYIARESEEACTDEMDDETCPSRTEDGPTTAALVSRHDVENGDSLWEEPIYDPLSGHLFASEESLFVSSEAVGTLPWQLNAEDGLVGEDPERISHGPAEHCYSDGTVFGFDSWNGIYWRLEITEDSMNTVVSEGAPMAADTLATDGERCYISSNSDMGTHGVVCLSVDGEKLWTHEFEGLVGMPTVATETVLYRDEETLYCVDPDDGEQLWTHSAKNMGSQFAVVDDILYTVDGRTVRAYRPG